MVVEEIDEKTWRLVQKLVYHSDIAGHDISVPAGFVTDFASVPRIPLAYWLTGNTAHEAAVIHDFLYQSHLVTRKMADSVLFEAMGVTDIPLWRRRLIYGAVRGFGWMFYGSGPKRLVQLGNDQKL